MAIDRLSRILHNLVLTELLAVDDSRQTLVSRRLVSPSNRSFAVFCSYKYCVYKGSHCAPKMGSSPKLFADSNLTALRQNLLFADQVIGS
jgi:hypothetical protein